MIVYPTSFVNTDTGTCEQGLSALWHVLYFFCIQTQLSRAISLMRCCMCVGLTILVLHLLLFTIMLTLNFAFSRHSRPQEYIPTLTLKFATFAFSKHSRPYRYTKGASAGACCPKSIVLPGKLMTPACTTCGGEFYQMDGKPTVGPSPPERNSSGVGEWSDPVIVETGTEAHQL